MEKALNKELNKIIGMQQSRREFLKLLGKGIGYSALATTLPGCGGGGGSPVIPVLPTSAEYSALKRTSFGVHRDELTLIQSMGINAYLEQQLDYQNINDGNLENTIQTLFPLPYQTPVQLLAGFPDNSQSIYTDMIAASHYRQIFSKRQLYEVMVEFWSEHFNIQLTNGLGPVLKPTDDLQVIRTHALGNFRNLLHASASSPAMLFYLDNFFNQAAAPNENYARELMELHTLGVNGGYTETDIKEVARCFTGWSIRFPNDQIGNPGDFVFHPSIHDNNAKTVLQNNIPANGGQSDGTQVLDILASHPSTAQHIARKLCIRFISDQPEQATINSVAAAFTSSNGEITDTLRALFASYEFQNITDQKFCRPSEYLAGMVRSLAPDTAYPTDNGALFTAALSILGQLPFNWPTPDGHPDSQTYWNSTSGWLNRWRMSFISYATLVPSINVFQIDYNAMLNGADTITTIVDALTSSILMRPVSTADRDHLLNWLMAETGQADNVSLPQTTIDQLAPGIAAVLVSSAYFQLR